ncbi:MAG: cell division protein ZapA [Gemmatimonadetes bacterium]|nr:cell division protein ZapA [Gemmatimonadota bacterium]
MTEQRATGGKETTRVTVLDEPFGIRSEADPDYTRRVAAHVDGRLRALRKSSPALEPFPVAVLGAMEITDDLFRSREAIGTAMHDAVYRIERLVGRIDRALEPGEPREADRKEDGAEG